MSAVIRFGLVLLVGSMMLAGAVAQDAPAKKKKQRKADPLAPIEDKAGLPRALIIGDSISIGYTLPTRKLLAGKANVHRIGTNGGPTIKGVAEVDKWLGDKKWDVIHFNWGLHDVKQVAGKHQVPIDEYEANLDKLVSRLEKTGAKLIWASTTPVPSGAGGRIEGDEVKYNEAAARVMKKHNVETNDLYAFSLPRLATIQQPANVHFTNSGSAELAKVVAAKIEAAIDGKKGVENRP